MKSFLKSKPSKFDYPKKRANYYDISKLISASQCKMSKKDCQFYESLDVIYRTLCSILYNYVPLSGHPGGSISSGRIVESLMFDNADYDFSNSDRDDADIISYAAGHKAMGLYAIWAIRNEMIRIAKPSMLAKRQLRLEDLLGFRRNPTNDTSLFRKFKSKALDGHPTPLTPFVKLSTGASGVGVGSSLGLALAALDIYPANPPKVHIIEGEGGLTTGRVHEAIAAAATGQYRNAILHLDWNQASIDVSHVCCDNEGPGDYVQWNPIELFYTQDWNVIYAEDGHNLTQVMAAQKLAL
jgi:transketolase